jgi:hypothetical protein
MFLHQQKSAGMSLRNTLKNYANAHNIRNQLVSVESDLLLRRRKGFCEHGWSFSDERPWCRDNAEVPWFTMVRDPWLRVKSAFYYCVQGAWHDVLCNVGKLHVPSSGSHTGDLGAKACAFAKRWGSNYQFEKYTHLGWKQLRKMPCAPKCELDGAEEYVHQCVRTAIQACALDSNRTAASRSLIAEAFQAQASMAAIGIVEEYGPSMRLFARVSGCDDLDAAKYSRTVAHPSLKTSQPATFAKVESSLEKCKHEVLPGMAIDYALYEHAKQLSHAQRRGAAGRTAPRLGAPMQCSQASAESDVHCEPGKA